MKHVTVLLSALALVLATHTFTRADAPSGVTRWEYKRIHLYDADYFKQEHLRTQLESVRQEAAAEGYDLAGRKEASKALAAAGREGWELVLECEGLGGIDRELLLKRPLK